MADKLHNSFTSAADIHHSKPFNGGDASDDADMIVTPDASIAGRGSFQFLEADYVTEKHETFVMRIATGVAADYYVVLPFRGKLATAIMTQDVQAGPSNRDTVSFNMRNIAIGEIDIASNNRDPGETNALAFSTRNSAHIQTAPGDVLKITNSGTDTVITGDYSVTIRYHRYAFSETA